MENNEKRKRGLLMLVIFSMILQMV